MRDRLEALYHTNPMGRYTFTAQFNKYSIDVEGTHNALFVAIKRDGHFAADHVWLRRSKAMKALELQPGDIVEFEAQVDRYCRNQQFLHMQNIEWEYSLCKIRNFLLIERRKDNEDE